MNAPRWGVWQAEETQLLCFRVTYRHAADTLEAESGFQLESNLVSSFRHSILEGRWDEAEEALEDLGVRDEDEVKVRMPPTRFMWRF